MEIKNKSVSIEEKTKAGRKRYVRSLEYELMASLALQQFTTEGEAKYAALLSVPLKDRIPQLIREYGLKRMHKLIKTVLQEFCYSIALPKSKKLNETRMSVVACDLILAAQEDQFSLEDLIVFFELAKDGKWGGFKGMVTHYHIMEKLEHFRQERYEFYITLKEKNEADLKLVGLIERTAAEPTVIKKLFDDVGGKIIPFKKIS